MLYRYVRRNLGAGAAEAEALARELSVMHPTAEILIGRGIATPEAGRAFMNPCVEQLRDPLGLAGMAEAVARIERAIAGHEKIVVYGDYDVDGVCAASILVEYLLGRGTHCAYYIPSRHTEGYGVNRKAVESLAGAGLLVTVDCGVSNGAELALARQLGMDVIVTDHHECPDELPDCTAVINPKRPGQAYGFSGLCGAGTALKLVQALGGLEAVEPALDLAALATVADIVPLTGENRAIVQMGLMRINRAERPGIRALLEVSGLTGKPVRAGSVSFVLAPRINAGGRMDLSRKSVELMLTSDSTRAREIAAELNDDNAGRVKAEEGILREAVDMIERGYSFSRRRAIVMHRPHWNTGVTGIVASRLVERYHRPVILFGQGEGACYGSGRSVPGVHLYRAMKACSEWFLRFGGHEQAAGCALPEEHVERFAEALDKHLFETYAEEVFLPLRQYDAELTLADLTIGLARDMDRLEPCGFGNPRPVFLLKDAELTGLARTADGKHLRMRLGRGGVEGIAFRQGDAYDALQGINSCDVLAVPSVNEWMGRERVQAVVEHIKPPQGFDYACHQVAGAGAVIMRSLIETARYAVGGSRVARLGYQQGVEALLEAVKRSCWGTLALCFTASGAYDVLNELNNHGLLERVYTGIGQGLQAARRENALVAAPELERLAANGYDSIFLFDGALTDGALDRILPRLNNGANCIIIDSNAEIPGVGQFTREGFLETWRALKAALGAGASRVWPFRLDGINPWQAEVSAAVFLELGLLQVINQPPWLGLTGAQTRVDLNDSVVYKRLTKAFRRAGDEPERQGARNTGLSDARHPLPGHHDAAQGR